LQTKLSQWSGGEEDMERALAIVRLGLVGHVSCGVGCLLLARFWFAHAQGDVCQLKEARTARAAGLTVIPCAIAVLTFESEARRNPEVL
jgi:hypothetical protein